MGPLISEYFRLTTPKEISPELQSMGSQIFLIVGEESAEEGARAFLRVTVDEHEGYGALSWHSDLRTGGMYDFFWVSDNPTPPATDPLLIASTHCGYTYDPACALPLEQVRAAVEEYCASGTGGRPTCIKWVPGDTDGSRNTESLFTEQVEEPPTRIEARPWSRVKEIRSPHPF